MSDEFAICPKCKCYDANIKTIKMVGKDEDEWNDEDIVECQDCNSQYTKKEIGWDYVEYYKGKVIR